MRKCSKTAAETRKQNRVRPVGILRQLWHMKAHVLAGGPVRRWFCHHFSANHDRDHRVLRCLALEKPAHGTAILAPAETNPLAVIGVRCATRLLSELGQYD